MGRQKCSSTDIRPWPHGMVGGQRDASAGFSPGKKQDIHLVGLGTSLGEFEKSRLTRFQSPNHLDNAVPAAKLLCTGRYLCFHAKFALCRREPWPVVQDISDLRSRWIQAQNLTSARTLWTTLTRQSCMLYILLTSALVQVTCAFLQCHFPENG